MYAMSEKGLQWRADKMLDAQSVRNVCAGETVCFSHPNLSVRASHCQKQMVPSAPVEDR